MENIENLKKFWNKKKVFVTGHTGFKGSWLCIILKYLKSNVYGYALKPERLSLFNKSKIKKFYKSCEFNLGENLKFFYTTQPDTSIKKGKKGKKGKKRKGKKG